MSNCMKKTITGRHIQLSVPLGARDVTNVFPKKRAT